MDVITTHLNADFDAFGSMVAARKLYPGAVVSFPGSQEKNVRDFFMESALYILDIERAGDIDLEKVERLILVDTRQKSRIGRFAAIAEAEGVEVHVYDHHPDSEEDVRGDLEVVEEVGATVTILIREIRKRGIDINAEEATVLALGLHEDTGSFTFSSTTPEDLQAAAWLMDKGANVNIIADMMTSDLSKGQIEVLHQLIEETEHVNVKSVDITVTTASVQGYVVDVALLVHKYREMENLDTVFALIRMDGRVHLVARSRVDEVNAAEVAAGFGGGGHPYAASATIRDLSLYEARDKLISLLRQTVRPKKEAHQIMSRPVITIAPDRSLEEAAESLSRYQITSLPVADANGRVLGILHRQSVERALHHGLQGSPVRDYMDLEVVTVDGHDSIEDVTHISVERGIRLVPVVEDGKLAGVISRSDLLEHMKFPLEKDSVGPDEYPVGRMRRKNVRKVMEEHFPDRVMRILRIVGDVAATPNRNVYLVGGAVRDLFLRIHNLDIDLVVEGDGIDFSKGLAARFDGCRVRSHEKFGTTVLLFEDGFKIDVATARHEFYARPGALPTVETSSIKRDLYRRDFTMNTLAVSLNKGSFGKVIDFFGGTRDIKDKIIRVLNNLSFVEDPTRILRAVRFSSRYGFTIGKHTMGLLKRAVRMKVFDKVEGTRLRNELIHMVEERKPLAPLALMGQLGVFEALHPALSFPPRTAELVESVSSVLAWWKYLYVQDSIEPWIVYFLALTDSLADEDFDAVLERFSFSMRVSRELRWDRISGRKALSAFARGEADRRSTVARALRTLRTEGMLLMMAKTSREETRRAISEYISRLRYVKPILTGKDLLAMGFEPGRRMGVILDALRDARVDGLVQSEADERAMVEELYSREAHETESLPDKPAELSTLS
jgi:tRNA nucleotidyltransferase (CCA-adding enzyme)